MDLHTVATFRRARDRDDLRLAPGESLVAGGTWVFSEPQLASTGLVDLTTLGWPAWETDDLPLGTALRVGATCTITDVLRAPWDPHVLTLVRSCVDAFLMSFKIQQFATVGGNLCLALPAGAMISLFAALAAEVVVWTPDGGERREPVTSFVRGACRTSLAPGEVVRALDVPSTAGSRFTFRRTSLTAMGRSAAVVTGRRVGDQVTVVVTGATPRPVVVEVPDGGDPVPLVAAHTDWYDDPHGTPDWRAAMSATLAAQVCAELRVAA